jgi:hypothetical protein
MSFEKRIYNCIVGRFVKDVEALSDERKELVLTAVESGIHVNIALEHIFTVHDLEKWKLIQKSGHLFHLLKDKPIEIIKKALFIKEKCALFQPEYVAKVLDFNISDKQLVLLSHLVKEFIYIDFNDICRFLETLDKEKFDKIMYIRTNYGLTFSKMQPYLHLRGEQLERAMFALSREYTSEIQKWINMDHNLFLEKQGLINDFNLDFTTVDLVTNIEDARRMKKRALKGMSPRLISFIVFLSSDKARVCESAFEWGFNDNMCIRITEEITYKNLDVFAECLNK